MRTQWLFMWALVLAVLGLVLARSVVGLERREQNAPSRDGPSWSSSERLTGGTIITDTEVLVLQEVAQAIGCPPEVQVSGTRYVVGCMVAAGHAIAASIERFPDEAAARAEFEEGRQDAPLRCFHAYPAYWRQWDERPDTPQFPMRHRIYAWLAGSSVVYVEAFDDTYYAIAPDPVAVSEHIHREAGERELFPQGTCGNLYMPAVLALGR